MATIGCVVGSLKNYSLLVISRAGRLEQVARHGDNVTIVANSNLIIVCLVIDTYLSGFLAKMWRIYS